MRIRRGLRAGLVSMVVMSALLFATGASAPSPGPSDGLAGFDLTNKSMQDQCAKPVTARTGGWVCIDPDGSRRLMHEQIAARQGRSVQAVAADPRTAAASRCSVLGCWTVYDSVSAGWSGQFLYGYKGQKLSYVDYSFEDRTQGTTTITKPNGMKSGRPMKNTKHQVERLLVTGGVPQGTWTDPRVYKSRTSSAVVPATYWSSFSPVELRNSSNLEGTVYHYIHWSDTSSAFPGTWYGYVKNVKIYRCSLGYCFHGDSRLPQTPAGGGYVA